MAKIEASAFRPIFDASLEISANKSKARVKMLPSRGLPTILEVFESVFGAWISDCLLGELYGKIDELAPTVAVTQHRRWKHFSYSQVMAFFLNQFLQAIKSLPLKDQDNNKIDALMQGLVSDETHKVICASLKFGDVVLKKILAGIPHCVQRLVELGGTIVVDEAIWPYYSPAGKFENKYVHIPSKPHKDGMLTYLLCQRFHFTNRPFALTFCPTFLDTSPTPREALMELDAHLLNAGFEHPTNWILVADSLWSYPSHILEFLELKWRFVVSAKNHTTAFPAELNALASKDLLLGHARTYSDGFLTAQVYHSTQGVTSIISNIACARGAAPPGDLPLLSYSTALKIFKDDSPASIVRAFNLPIDSVVLPKALLVHRALRWDVLQPATDQGSTAPLSREVLQSFARCQVEEIFKLKFPKIKTRSLSVEMMIEELCPSDNRPLRPESLSAKKKHKLDDAALQARLKQAQGTQTEDHRIYDVFHEFYSCIDQMDKEFYAHGRLRWTHGANANAVQCAAFYLLSTCHSIFEEYHREHIHAQTKGNNMEVLSTPALSITDYLITLVTSFKQKYPHPYKME